MWARLRDLAAVALLLASLAAIVVGVLALVLTGQWALAAVITGFIGAWCALQLGTHDPDARHSADSDEDQSGPTRADSRA